MYHTTCNIYNIQHINIQHTTYSIYHIIYNIQYITHIACTRKYTTYNKCNEHNHKHNHSHVTKHNIQHM